MNIEALMKQLTLEEKASLVEGFECWTTSAVERLGIPGILLTDGPVGVRRQLKNTVSSETGAGTSYEATAFPATVNLANSWSPELVQRMGTALGEESRALGVDVILGPAMNIQRDPRCGRNFEYFSEDPELTGTMATAFVKGVQSTGTAACVKHFALNNCENYRYMSDSVCDERTMREIYLKAFEKVVKDAALRCLMGSYNKINGVQGSQNSHLLSDILRREWGFDGVVMTDWGATLDRPAGIIAGTDLDMPGGCKENKSTLIAAAKANPECAAALDDSVRRILKLVDDARKRSASPKTQAELMEEHKALSVELAEKTAVLLKNRGDALPLKTGEKLLVIGDLFAKLRFQGGGSSAVTPAWTSSPANAFDNAGVHYAFCRGYDEMTSETNMDLAKEALEAAVSEETQTILFFGGLTELAEFEGCDRPDLKLPENQVALIDALCKLHKKVVLVLFGGSPVELPFEFAVDAILDMFLPGQGGGEACRRLLFGEASPRGRLAQSWPATDTAIPGGETFGKHKVIPYRESIFTGYRYYNKNAMGLRYPFGYGLSYTNFKYDNLRVAQESGVVTATVTVTNDGTREGTETVQLYVGKNKNSAVFKAEKELKAFSQVTLKPEERAEVTMSFPEKELAYYNPVEGRWVLENGEYRIMVAQSADAIPLSAEISVTGGENVAPPYSAEVVNAYASLEPSLVTDEIFETLLGRKIPEEPTENPFTMETPIKEFLTTKSGTKVYNMLMKHVVTLPKEIDKMPDGPKKDAARRGNYFVSHYMPYFSLRSICQGSGGRMTMPVARGLLDLANGKALGSVKHFLGK